MKRVMVFGTFDGVHAGHRSLFQQAAERGSHVIAVIARDVTVENVKGRLPQNDEQKRCADVAEVDEVQEVVLGSRGADKCRVVREHQPHVIMLGYDQAFFIDALEELALKDGHHFTVVRARAYKPEKYKSTLLNDR